MNWEDIKQKIKPYSNYLYWLVVLAMAIVVSTSIPNSFDSKSMEDCLEIEVGEPKVCYATFDAAGYDSGIAVVITVEHGLNSTKTDSWKLYRRIFWKESDFID